MFLYREATGFGQTKVECGSGELRIWGRGTYLVAIEVYSSGFEGVLTGEEWTQTWWESG